MSVTSKSCKVLYFVVLLLASYACIHLEFWKPRCDKPFIEISDKCYFFSTNKAPSYEYYKVVYKGHIFSVPAILDWLQAGFACETLDSKARMVSIESLDEMIALADYMREYAHASTHPLFWSAGHRGSFAHEGFDKSSFKNFYWHEDAEPMNFTNFIEKGTNNSLPYGYCVYLEFIEDQLIMGSANCKHKLAFACELEPSH